jgi:hypothetical protein
MCRCWLCDRKMRRSVMCEGLSVQPLDGLRLMARQLDVQLLEGSG